MAMAARIRSTSTLFHRLLRPTLHQTLLCPEPELSKNYSIASPEKDEKVKVPLALFGVFGNYASALYLAAVKGNVLDRVESELLDLVQASRNSPSFSQFTKDPSVPAKTRVKAINEIFGEAKFSDLTKNFLGKNGSHVATFTSITDAGTLRVPRTCEVISRASAASFEPSWKQNPSRDNTKHVLKFIKRFQNNIVLVFLILMVVILYQPLLAEEERELKETLQEIIGQGKQVKLEQKIDPSILGGLVVEYGQKLFDMSIRKRARQMERFLREPIDVGSLKDVIIAK
ncbi:hypothetical protein V6N12_013902 [Hibiscus sabdariffa]|uniref:Uncharacterized protein n=1 Tax=Hibiscus sabdariffa TaxID=183260 RepID=A0ABR2B0W5_9ROSI